MTRAPLAVLVVCSLLLPQTLQAATFTVTSTADTLTAGTLRTALTSAALGDTIAWGAGGQGTITLGSNLPAVGAGTTIDVSLAPAAVTFAGSPNAIPLAGAANFTNGVAAQPWTISSVINGAGSLIKNGAGTLILTGNNAYAGGTVINAGVLNVNSDAALGALGGSISFNGGLVPATLQTSAGIASARSLITNSAATFDTQGFNSTLSGPISGVGSLSILGTGTLALTGNNTYAGNTVFGTGTLSINNSTALGTGTLFFGGGTLRVTAANLSITSMTLTTAADSLDTQGNSVTLSGAISGSGSLNIKNDVAGTVVTVASLGNNYNGGTVFNRGTLNISNANALGSGPITFNGGVLQTASTSTIGNTITLNSGGGIFDSQGNPSIFNGSITGVGSLTNVSTATLYLQGINSYSGGTFLTNGGILNINNYTALGTGSLTFSSGTLQMLNGLSLAQVSSMTIMNTGGPGNAGGGTIDTNGYLTLAPILIGGPGAFTKTGPGTLVLQFADTWGGATTVAGGTLGLGINNALPVGTALTVVNGATFDLGAYTQTVASYNGSGGGTMAMILKPGVTNLTVTGNANMTNGVMSVTLPAGSVVKKGDVFTPVQAASFTGNTPPATVLSPAAISFAPTIVGNNVVLTASLVPLASLSASPNQAAIGSALEPLRVNPTGDTAQVLSSLYSLNIIQLQAAMDQIGPLSLASMGGVGMAGASVQSAAVGQRLAVLADGRDHTGFSQYSVARRSFYPGTLVAEAGEADEPAGNQAEANPSGSPWGYFATGGATAGRLNEANGSAGFQPGYAFNSGGLTVGADYRLDEHFTLGAAGGYLHGHSSVYLPASGTVDDNSGRLGVYGAAVSERFHADLYLGGAYDTFTTKRGISFGSISRTATGSPHGGELNANANAAYDWKYADWGVFSPFAGINYQRLMIGRFTETGAGSLDLSVNAQTIESLQSTLGMRYAQKFETDHRSYTPYLSLGWRHEFDDQSRPITAQFAGGGGTPFSVTTGSYARNGTVVGSGLAIGFGKNVLSRLDWSSDFRSHYQDTTVNASVRLRF